MKKRFIFILLFLPLLAVSCDKTGNGEEDDNYFVTLSVDKNQIGLAEEAKFTVTYGEQDVTAEAVIKNVTTGETIASDNPVYEGKKTGTADFRAEYKEKNSNTVTVAVIRGNVAGLSLEPDIASYRFGTDEKILFKVYYNNIDVTAASVVTDVDTGVKVPLEGDSFAFPLGGNSGTLKFTAEYNEMTTKVLEIPAADFFKSVLLFRFTGTWCTYCHPYASVVAIVEEEYPGRIVHIAPHFDDEMQNDHAEELVEKFDITGFPRSYWDYYRLLRGYNMFDDVVATMEGVMKNNPAKGGLSVSTTIEGSKVKVTVKAAVMEAAEYYLAVALTENKVTGYPQSSPEGWTDGSYEHMNVLRDYVTPTDGEKLGSLEKGNVVEKVYTIDLGSWNKENCNVAVYLNFMDGKTLKSTNAMSVKAGQSQGFIYE
jgi:Thiol-disulfide isomerase and thioredoxins